MAESSEARQVKVWLMGEEIGHVSPASNDVAAVREAMAEEFPDLPVKHMGWRSWSTMMELRDRNLNVLRTKIFLTDVELISPAGSHPTAGRTPDEKETE